MSSGTAHFQLESDDTCVVKYGKKFTKPWIGGAPMFLAITSKSETETAPLFSEEKFPNPWVGHAPWLENQWVAAPRTTSERVTTHLGE